MSAGSIREINILLEGVITKLAGKVMPKGYLGNVVMKNKKDIEEICRKTLQEAEYAISSSVVGLFIELEKMLSELRDGAERDFGRELTEEEARQLQEDFSYFATEIIEKESRDPKKFCFYERYKQQWEEERKGAK